MVFKRSITLLIVALLLVIIVVFTLQNASVVKIRLLFWDIEASLSLIIFAAFILGAVITTITLLPTLLHSIKSRSKVLPEEENSSEKE